MKRITTTLLALLLCCSGASADEGMWLIHQLQRIYPSLVATGLQLSAEELYNPQGVDLSDAVVAIDGGMGSGSMISDQGLMITNHHVAFSDICNLSTPEKNYLKEGFWARNREEELPVEGKTVMFLRRVKDISEEATAYRDSMERIGRWNIMGPRKLLAEMERRHRQEGLEPWCATMWDGRLTLLLQYEVYRDIRLVGAPPERIGAFGGETDNWSWPQHKGDFALYRIYGDSLGRPAPYSPDNQPIRPQKVLKISTEGVNEGDYAMVIGFPGRTHRYGSSMSVREKEMRNPIIERCRHDRMEVIRRHMEADSLVKLAYSDGYFNLSNYADFVRWEEICLKRYNVVGTREAEEAELSRWVAADTALTTRYGTLLEELARGYEARREAIRIRTWYQESWFMPSKALIAANRAFSTAARLVREKRDSLEVTSKEHKSLVQAAHHLEEGFDSATDRELFIRLFQHFVREVPDRFWGDHLRSEMARYEGNGELLAAETFDRSFCRDGAAYRTFLRENRAAEELLNDPLVAFARSVEVQPFTQEVTNAEREVGCDVSDLEAEYRRLQYEFREAKGVPQYPDANSTMRLTYGRVAGLTPRDGICYDHLSTVKGYLEKENPENYNFEVDERMKALIREHHSTEYPIYVNFLTDNDITGGNSGSPVLNGRGELIGLAFDGNRESMAGDLWFHPELSRTVAVDIRFVLWFIDHYAEADYLLSEVGVR